MNRPLDYNRLKAAQEILALWQQYKDQSYVRRAIHLRALDPINTHLHDLMIDEVIDEVLYR